MSPDTIVISPIGDIDPPVIQRIAREFNRIFPFRTAVTPLLPDVEFARDADRRQYHSTQILETLQGQLPSGALKILAVTEVDLFIPILTHVFGEAKLGGPVCIISLHRLRENVASNPALECRIAKEAIHEMGHCFNLRHCHDKTCIMNYCRSVADVDRRSEQLCRYCRVLLSDELKRLGRRGRP